jgi:hypothetical protein
LTGHSITARGANPGKYRDQIRMAMFNAAGTCGTPPRKGCNRSARGANPGKYRDQIRMAMFNAAGTCGTPPRKGCNRSARGANLSQRNAGEAVCNLNISQDLHFPKNSYPTTMLRSFWLPLACPRLQNAPFCGVLRSPFRMNSAQHRAQYDIVLTVSVVDVNMIS